jgi:hypothetical protein
MRKCIKCGRPEGEVYFTLDNWRHKVNQCRDCHREYVRNQRKIKVVRELVALTEQCREVQRNESDKLVKVYGMEVDNAS